MTNRIFRNKTIPVARRDGIRKEIEYRPSWGGDNRLKFLMRGTLVDTKLIKSASVNGRSMVGMFKENQTDYIVSVI